MLTELKKYSNIERPQLPNTFAENEEKLKPEYFKTKAEYLFWAYMNGLCTIPYSQALNIETARAYAAGNQPVTKYQDILCPLNQKTMKRATWGYENISWQIFSVMPKLMAWVEASLGKIEFATNVQAVDELSENEKYMDKLKVMAESEFADDYAMLYAAADAKQPKRKLPFRIRGMEDLDMLSEVGNFKLACEIIFERKIKKSCNKSKWNDIKTQLIQDALSSGLMATQTYNDPVTNMPMVEYVDTARLLALSSRSKTYNHITDAAQIKLISLTQLKAYGLTDEQLHKALQQSQGCYGNPSMLTQMLNNSSSDYSWDNWLYKYSDWKIAYMDGECETLEVEQYEYRVKKGVDAVAIKVPLTNTYPSDKKNRLEVKKYNKWYRYKWIIGTDVVFDYGYQYDQVYDQEDRPRSSFSIYRVAEKSIVSQCIATLDDLQITIMKLRAAWAKARPSGVDIEISALSDVRIGGDKYDPWQLLAIYYNTGVRFWKKSLNPLNGLEVIGGMPPIQDNKGTSLEEFNKFFVAIDMYINQLREITGVAPVIDGSAPAPNQLPGVTKINLEGSNNVLRPIAVGYQYMKGTVSENLAYRHQLIAKMNHLMGIPQDMEGLYLATLPDLHSRVLDINVTAMVDDEMKARIDAMALESMKAAMEGKPGITPADYLFIQRCLQEDQLKFAEYYLSARAFEERQIAAEIAAQNQQANTDGAIRIEAEKRATKMETLEAEIKKMRIQYDLELRNGLLLNKQEAALTPKPQPATAA